MKLSMSLAKPINKIKEKLSGDFIRNFGWLSGAEFISRIFRLISTVVLARCFTPQDYGLAALVLTTYEFTQVFTRFGIGAKLIQADKEDLEELSNAAYWLNWTVCFGLFILQCIAAFPVAWFYHENRLIAPICALATVYLITPIGRIQTTLIQREKRLKITALTNVVQLSTGSLLTALFALLGMGIWAVVLSKILASPIEAAISLSKHSWRRSKKLSTKHWGEIFNFGISMLGTALLATLRNNLDYLIIARFLGVKELGIYYFAFNAGLGISLSIYQSIGGALYPHLCAARSNWDKLKECYFSSLKTIAFIIIPFVFLQSSLAPFYVPIVFGKKWIMAIPILIIICLSAIPRPFYLAASYLLTAIGKPDLVWRWNVLFTLVFTAALLIGVYWQSLGVAVAVLLTNIAIGFGFTIWATRYVFYKQQKLIKERN